MRAWLYKRRYLMGYLGIVAVSICGALLYQHFTVAELNRHDERSCAQRNKLALNQVAVIRSLSNIITLELDELDGESANHTGHRQELMDDFAELRERLKTAGPEVC